MAEASGRLTRHAPASFRELVILCYPLMLAALSTSLMMFFDRIILAQYNVDDMNAAAGAGMVTAVFQYFVVALTGMAQVFVGRRFGAKELLLLGQPVWQMIWLTLAISPLFFIIAIWGADLLLPELLGQPAKDYFFYVMSFGWLLPMYVAISSFFIGQGKVKIITILSLLANAVNLGLDLVLIFGIGPFPAMGAKGAAIATVIAQALQVVILAYIFLLAKNREKFGSFDYKLRFKLLKESLSVGWPNAVGHMFEIAAWAVLLYMLGNVSKAHVTVLTLGQTIFILFYFLTDGMQKGVSTIASNALGAEKPERIKRLVRSMVLLVGAMAFILFWPLVIWPDVILQAFLSAEHEVLDMDTLQAFVQTTFIWLWIYFIMDWMVWAFAGILTAGKDTKFIMVANALNAWLFAIVPMYLFVVKPSGSPELIWKLLIIYGAVNFISFYLRYRAGHWRKIGV